MKDQFTEYERKILGVLSTSDALTTRQVSKRVEPLYCNNRRMHSGAIRSWLMRLERDGHVVRLDYEKPVCWLLAKIAS